MHISLAWWNTSLSPPKGQKKPTEEDVAVAIEVIRFLTEDCNVDILALGEITWPDVEDFISTLRLFDYGFYDGTTEGQLKFDTGVLYKTDKLRLLDSGGQITSNKGRSSFKTANELNFIIPEENLLNLFVSHWPSKRYREKSDYDFIGDDLRRAVKRVENSCENEGIPAFTILMGDFNQEPFEDSIWKHLMATRDRNFAKKYPAFMYNPFWRQLGERFPYPPPNSPEFCGSYYYPGGEYGRWFTFDQIIFSSAFLGQNEWRLNENHTGILMTDILSPYIFSSKSRFDHFPVFSVIERNEK